MICRTCKEDKENNEYANGRRVCKKCASKRCMEWAKNNKDKVLQNSKKFRENNRELCRKRCLELYHRQPWKNKEWLNNNTEEQAKYQKKYREIIKKKLEKEIENLIKNGYV